MNLPLTAMTVKMKAVVCCLAFFVSSSLSSQQPKLVLPVGHTSIVVSAAFSPDDKYIVTASWDNTAKVWQAADGKLLFDLKYHTGSVTSASFSSDGKYILTSSKDNTAKIWDASNGKLLQSLIGHHDWVNAASFSSDGKYVITASWDSTAKVWDASNGKLIFDLKNHKAAVSTASFSNDGKYIVTASLDGIAKTWDASNGKELYEFTGHHASVYVTKFTPDGKYIVTASADGIVKIWNTDNGKLVQELKAHESSINDVSFSSDGKFISTCSSDSTAKIWELSTGKLLYVLKGHLDVIKSVVYDRENKFLLTAAADNTARIWDASNGQLLYKLKGHLNWVNHALFSHDGKYIVTSSSDNTAKIWRAKDGSLVNNLYGHVSMTSYAAFSPDNKFIVSVSGDSTAKIWNNENGRLIKNIRNVNWMSPVAFSSNAKYFVVVSFSNDAEVYELTDGKLVHQLKGHDDWISSAAFSNDGKYITTTSWDSTVKIWNASNGELLHNLNAHKDVVQSASFSNTGKYLVTASWDNDARIWRVVDGKLLHTLKSHKGKIRTAIFSANEQYILTSSWDSTAKIWEANSGKLIRTLKGHYGFVNEASFSADGKKILTCSMDSTAKIWNAIDGKLIHTLSGHTRPVMSAIFSKDGKTIYTSSWDNTAKAWNVADGHLLFSMESHSAPLNSISLSNDEMNILTSSEDNTIKKWNAKSGKLLYSFFAVDSTDYLSVDEDGRFDGTEAARKKLYYACDHEVVDLEQFKNLAWEPSLAAKISGYNKEPISAKKISDMNICNYTPVITEKETSNNAYEFQIMPRSGGLGIVELYVNNKLIKEYDPSSLNKNADSYLLSVDKKDIEEYFSSNDDNRVSVKATTENGVMQSRGDDYSFVADNRMRTAPNMYLISVGVSDYKSKDIKLSYASKDAANFSSAVTIAAQKLLNTDGRQHVFSYNFGTDQESPRKAFKNEIRHVMDTIIQKAKPDDILVAFFAGHGILPDGQKKFYMLTAEASSFNVSGVENDVAISTDELNEWSRKIKANKQVLILDACHSGQVINNLQQMMRGDIPADQQRALENLRDRTGLYILSASEPNQGAQESQLFNQGFLTYSLLSGIKLGGGLRDNKFIDVSRLFNFASDQVRRMAKASGVDQDPQILGSASFDVGIVDKDVTDNIRLTVKKKIFRRSRFIQDEELITDDIDLSGLVDKELSNVYDLGKERQWVFIPDNIFDSSYSIHGKYSVTGKTIAAKVILIKGQKEKLFQFELNGIINKKDELVRNIIEKIRTYFKLDSLLNSK
ncbi:MAG TPA: caspase family protein [Puia sp.]|nr:caspase family protein [Puia sp.]